MEAFADNESTVNQARSGSTCPLRAGCSAGAIQSARSAGAFPGLAAFTADQQEIFFGRERQVADVIKLIDEHAEHGGDPLPDRRFGRRQDITASCRGHSQDPTRGHPRIGGLAGGVAYADR